jgi:hypothetical protein
LRACLPSVDRFAACFHAIGSTQNERTIASEFLPD